MVTSRVRLFLARNNFNGGWTAAPAGAAGPCDWHLWRVLLINALLCRCIDGREVGTLWYDVKEYMDSYCNDNIEAPGRRLSVPELGDTVALVLMLPAVNHAWAVYLAFVAELLRRGGGRLYVLPRGSTGPPGGCAAPCTRKILVDWKDV